MGAISDQFGANLGPVWGKFGMDLGVISVQNPRFEGDIVEIWIPLEELGFKSRQKSWTHFASRGFAGATRPHGPRAAAHLPSPRPPPPAAPALSAYDAMSSGAPPQADPPGASRGNAWGLALGGVCRAAAMSAQCRKGIRSVQEGGQSQSECCECC